MVKKWLGALAGLVTSAGFALAQTPAPNAWTPNLSPFASIPSTLQPVRYQPEAPAPLPATLPSGDSSNRPLLYEGDADGPGFWFQAEYLLWRVKSSQSSSGPVFGTIPTALANAPDLPAGSITGLPHDPSRAHYGDQDGLRFGAGFWLDGAREWAVEGSWFQLEKATRRFQASSNGDPVIGPVFEDPISGRQTIILYAIPNGRAAELDAQSNNRLWGAEINLRRQLPAIFFADRLDLLVGYRHLQFSEGLELDGTHSALPGFQDPVAGTTSYTDRFGVHNDFDGAQIGLASHADFGPFTVDVIGKLALGGMQEHLNIDGLTTLIDPVGAPGTTITRVGGVLTQPTSIGRFTHSNFSIVPEVTANLGWRITPRLKATVGYNFLFVDKLFRVQDQIGGVDGRQVFGSTLFTPNAQPAPTLPQPQGSTTSFWAQGINLGLEFSF